MSVPWPSQYKLMSGKTMKQEFSTDAMTGTMSSLTTPSSWLDMEPTQNWETITWSETLGIPHGERKDISESKELLKHNAVLTHNLHKEMLAKIKLLLRQYVECAESCLTTVTS